MRLVHRSFCLTQSLLERLDAEAARRGVTTAAVLRWSSNLGLRQLQVLPSGTGVRTVHSLSTGLVPFRSTGCVGENHNVVVSAAALENGVVPAPVAADPGPGSSYHQSSLDRTSSNMDDGTRGAAADVIAEAKARIEQALAYLDHYPDNVLALESAVVQLRSAIDWLECPVEG